MFFTATIELQAETTSTPTAPPTKGEDNPSAKTEENSKKADGEENEKAEQLSGSNEEESMDTSVPSDPTEDLKV